MLVSLIYACIFAVAALIGALAGMAFIIGIHGK